MTEDTRTFEELKAEQDAEWAEINSRPVPPGYDEYLRETWEEGLREIDKPGAKLYTQTEVERIMAEQKLARHARARKIA